MRITSLLLAGGLALLGALSAPALAARPSIAVLPFSMDRNVVITTGRTLISGTVEDQSSLLTNELIHQLVATRKFDVLERTRVDDLIKEKELQDSDFAAPDEAAKIARLLGADYFVLGRIDDFDVEIENKTIPYSSQTYQQHAADIDLYLRVVDARSGRIVAAEKFESEARVRVVKDKKTPNVGKLVVSQAAQDMVGRITNTVFPVKVARVEGRTLYLNRGADGNLKAGDLVAVYSQGQAIVDSDTGETLGHTESQVAEARVTAVEARFTKAELVADAAVAGGVTEGMLVRRQGKPGKTTAPPAELPPGPRW